MRGGSQAGAQIFAILKCKKLLLSILETQLFLDLGVENVVLNVTVSSSHFRKWLYNVCPRYELTKCAFRMALLERQARVCVCVKSLQSRTIHDNKTQNPRTELQLKHIILFFCFYKNMSASQINQVDFPNISCNITHMPTYNSFWNLQSIVFLLSCYFCGKIRFHINIYILLSNLNASHKKSCFYKGYNFIKSPWSSQSFQMLLNSSHNVRESSCRASNHSPHFFIFPKSPIPLF